MTNTALCVCCGALAFDRRRAKHLVGTLAQLGKLAAAIVVCEYLDGPSEIFVGACVERSLCRSARLSAGLEGAHKSPHRNTPPATFSCAVPRAAPLTAPAILWYSCVVFTQRHMVSTLQALRSGAEVLVATMDVFLNEPVVDWISDGVDERQKKSKRGTTSAWSNHPCCVVESPNRGCRK